MESYMLLSGIWLVTSSAIRLLVIHFGFVNLLRSRAKALLGIRRSRRRLAQASRRAAASRGDLK
jgi:hypothetical protein